MTMNVAGNPLTRHGGRLDAARALYPDAPRPWIDLSTGINPTPYPAPRASTRERARLPELQQLSALETTAARAFGVDDPDRIIAVAGSEGALRLLPQVLPSARGAIIVWPTYSSHADAWQRQGAPVSRVDAITRASPVPGAVLTLVNPNNPDGVVTEPESLLEAHDRMAAEGGYLVVDEAFAEVEPSCSVAALAGSERYSRLVVLRSFGKFYGLAGVRLGFLIAAPAIIARARASVGDWPIAADAIAAGLAAYADTTWAERARIRLRGAARRVDALLTRNELSVVGGTSLFRLARSPIAPIRFEQLLRAGILVRPFDHDATLLRFGLPHGTAAWQRLRDALRPAP
jgi:cobalamin biosynthesis protein CobC